MRHDLYILLFMLLNGCSYVESGGITTGSRIYDAKYAHERGLNQAQTSACETEGREVWRANSTSDFANLKAGQAFEACVRKTSGKP